MTVIAYAMRHGVTDLSPLHEGQTDIPMNPTGISQVEATAQFIKWKQKQKQLWGVSSDLRRAELALEICSKVLNLNVIRPMAELRNLGDDETNAEFERRLTKAFAAILATAARVKGIPLISTHRSVTAWISKEFSGVQQEIDYRRAAVVWEGGLL